MFERLYRYLNKEDQQRVCTDITEEACKHAPRNFFLQIFSNVFTQFGGTLSNPKTVLTWLMSYVSAPVYLISLIVPLRESGSMVPQVFFAQLIRKHSIRKWIWVTGALLQFLAIASIGLIALNFKSVTAGWLIVAAVVLFSLSRSMSSLTSKDIMGKTIPKTRRGRLKGYSVSVSGVLVLAAGLFMLYQSQNNATISFYTTIIFFAASTWLVAAVIYSRIKEFPSKIKKEEDDKYGILSSFALLKTDKHFRDFILARTLLLCTALSAPFYVILAQEHVGKEAYLLGLFIIAKGVASILSSPIWGRYADKSSKNIMAAAVLIASFLGIFIFFTITYFDSLRSAKWLYPVVLFILGIAHQGVRLGRKTYVIDMATENERTSYVSVSNTVIGIILLMVGGLSALVSLLSVEGVILLLSLLGLVGAYKSYKLPNVEKI
ncbi:MFS transporter [Draconibacterium halophilum]|uniref:MFS transporter n=1 Tax=Draconibacterium halophilum TaxID=2706887 RepID=A0A6C0RI17_9BACT|nr:MFS transporter [Draconibacterium halophilum]QIA09295.1 MFS transporter [Draconibacterium halophilum]